MAYFTPYIDEKGVHIPTYADRLESLLSSYRTIFGADINLEISSPDYQLLSLFARSLDDLSQLILADFNSRNPQYASGAALDLLLPLAGLTRRGATYSTVPLTLSGTPNAVLPAAPEALDDNGHLWRCQTAGIQLDENGENTVYAICTTPGAVTAAAGSVHKLVTPVAGLSSAVNRNAATAGLEAETDASCRNRLRNAAASPAVSTTEALRGAILGVKNVTSCVVYENNSDAADSHGIPAHSICVMVSGGATAALAPLIFAKKAPGIGTHGSINAQVTDSFGEVHTVHFQRSTSAAVALTVELKPLNGFDEAVKDKIREALTAYSASLQIGQDLVVPSLYGLCYGVEKTSSPTFSITLLSASYMGSSTTDVLTAAWNQRFTMPTNMIQILTRP